MIVGVCHDTGNCGCRWYLLFWGGCFSVFIWGRDYLLRVCVLFCCGLFGCVCAFWLHGCLCGCVNVLCAQYVDGVEMWDGWVSS